MALRLSGLMLVGALIGAAAIAMATAGAPPRVRAATGSWTGKYYDNITLSGAPVLTRDDGPVLGFYYDGDAPGPGINLEQFSVRWTRADDYAAGTYRITVNADDGMRVYVDGARVIDAWFDQDPTTYTADIALTAGTHHVRADYYNNLPQATAFVWIDPLETAADATAIPTATDLPAEATGTVEPVATATAPVTSGTVEPASTAGATRTAVRTRTAAVSPTVERTATIEGAGSPLATPTPSATPAPGTPPRIECLWALPDMNSAEAGIQYTPSPDADVHDDNMAVVPDADNNASNGVQPPCAGPPASAPSQPDGARHLMQVVPNLDDIPDERRIQLWMAADVPAGGPADDSEDAAASEDGPDDDDEFAAFWYVYYPDGSPVGGVAATQVAARDCATYGGASGPVGSMFEAATHTGQIAPASVSDPALGLIALCQQTDEVRPLDESHRDEAQACREHADTDGAARCPREATRLFRGEFPLSKDQPCGEYRIVAFAVAPDGATATLSATFDVLCIFGLRVDFNSVDWGTLTRGRPQVIDGDTAFLPPTDAAPTVKNAGNDGMGLKLRFSTLTGASSGQTIEEFHGCFGRSALTLQCINPITAGSLAVFDTDPARALCANETGRLDLGIHPLLAAAADRYSGMLTLIGYHIPDRCAGHRHLP